MIQNQMFMMRTISNSLAGSHLRKMVRVMVWFALLAIALASCKPSIPSKYLSKSEMADVLYDLHIAEAMASVDYKDTAAMVTYREAVLKKHDVSLADFDSSMVYYMRHTKLMHEVYQELSDRLTDEAQSLGADVSENNRYGAVAMGDTANVWNGPTALVFSADAAFNHYSFDIPVDSAFHKGDKLILDFESQFIYQDGMRDGIAYLAVTFKNDSVATTNLHVTSSQHYNLTLEDRDSMGIKSVRGYFLLNSGDFSSGSSSLTTLKLMFIQHIKLVRMHPAKKTEEKNNQAADSVGNSGRPLPPPRPGMPRPDLSSPDKNALPPDRVEKMEVSRP